MTEAAASMVRLSFDLGENTPGYGGSDGFGTRQLQDLDKGDTSNCQQWRLFNHIGTHIDAPKHFSKNGATIDQFPDDFWRFERVALIDYAAQPGELLGPEVFANGLNENTELVLIRTGFEARRMEQVYWENNPGVRPECGSMLRESYPKLRAIGFDFISLSAYQNRPLGRVAHRAFLEPDNPGTPILIIEEMRLAVLETLPKWVLVAPLMVKGADGAPVTVFAGC